MQKDSERAALNDPVFNNWNLNKNGGGPIDGVLLVAGIKMATVEAELQNVLRMLNVGGEVVVELFRETGAERANQPGHEQYVLSPSIYDAHH